MAETTDLQNKTAEKTYPSDEHRWSSALEWLRF